MALKTRGGSVIIKTKDFKKKIIFLFYLKIIFLNVVDLSTFTFLS